MGKKRTIVRFTEEEKQYLFENYPHEQTWKLAAELGVSKKKIDGFAYHYKLKKADDFRVIRIDNKFNYEQADYIIENFANKTNQELADELNCSVYDIGAFARRQGLKKSNKVYERSSKLTSYQKQFILDNYENMLTAEICEKLHLSATVIRSYAFRHGVRKSPDIINKFSNQGILSLEQKQFIIDNYSKMKNKDICNILQITDEQLRGYANNRKLIKNFDVAYKNEHYFEECLAKNIDDSLNICKVEEPMIDESKLYKSNHGKYFVNQDYFEVIDNEWKAYWLGFLYADGCVCDKNGKGKSKNMVSLSLSELDANHVRKFAKSLQTDSPVYIRQTNYKNKKCANLNVNNQKLCKDLIDLGCVPRKSLTLTFPTSKQVPEHLIRHFIRGYFDGDGCIYVNKEKRNVRINFTGTLEFLTKLQEILVKECDFRFTKIQHKKNNKAYSLQYAHLRCIENFYRYLYKDCNVVLDRKFEKFNSIFSLE